MFIGDMPSIFKQVNRLLLRSNWLSSLLSG